MLTKGTTELPPAARLAWLRLFRADNVGPATFRQLLDRFGSAEAALDALPALARRAIGGPIRIPSLAEAEDEVEGLARLGGRFVALCEPAYPALLRHAAGPPPLLALVGGSAIDWDRAVGMVGARNASGAGQRMARILAEDLGRAGYAIVSGLARGIDAAAHRASLGTGTVAVLAGGADRIYPEENHGLAREIVEAGGALVTEMPLGWEPRARDFPRRNRLVAGLSLGVVVVEAARRSGSLITARLALEQDREVFAVPGSPLDPRAEGGNALIQQGARLVTSAADVLDGLRVADPARRTLFEPDWVPPAPTEPEPRREPQSEEREALLTALSPTPIPIDALIAATGLSASAMQGLLLELDLAGRLEWSAGQLVALRP